MDNSTPTWSGCECPTGIPSGGQEAEVDVTCARHDDRSLLSFGFQEIENKRRSERRILVISIRIPAALRARIVKASASPQVFQLCKLTAHPSEARDVRFSRRNRTRKRAFRLLKALQKEVTKPNHIFKHLLFEPR